MRFYPFYLYFIFLISTIYCDEQLSFLGFPRGNWSRPIDTFDEISPNVSSSSNLLIASPDIIDNNQDVIVSWNGINNVTSKDWIAIFCPAEEGSDQNYLDYLYTNSESSHGSVRFENLLNMRCTYGFRYYRANKVNGRYPLVAISNHVTMKQGKTQVLQVHTSLTSNPSEMMITWVTGSNLYDPYVYYGLSKTDLQYSQYSNKDSSLTYYASDMCGSIANETSQQTFRNPGWIHNVIITNLEPNTIYYYKCGNPIEGWSDLLWLKSSSFSNNISINANLNTNFIVYGDMGVSSAPGAISTSTRVTNEIYTGSQFILHIGDISYARGLGYIWEQFFNIIQPIASHVPYMINIGNHEYDHLSGGNNDPSDANNDGFHPSWGNYGDDSHGECSVPMFYRFSSPSNGHGIYWYSYDYGNVHILMMSTEHNFTKGSEQYEWMENDLASVDRNKTPFIVFGGHRAMYESEAYWSDWEVSIGMRKAFENLLYTYKVDIAFWGHYHAYQRTCSVYQGKCNTNGTTHIVVGTAGASLDNALLIQRPWNKVFIADYGYCKIKTTRTEMIIQFIHNSNGSIGDEVILQSRF